ncbi:hypothetical protein ASZ90_015718 [hydrocarbon metagenome]|uniref:Uncharacterized protein n=1 Tax=hydrocarbon metagenome TaxID=938273 RepID=A0A0W8F159_9ZZZZ
MRHSSGKRPGKGCLETIRRILSQGSREVTREADLFSEGSVCRGHLLKRKHLPQTAKRRFQNQPPRFLEEEKRYRDKPPEKQKPPGYPGPPEKYP